MKSIIFSRKLSSIPDDISLPRKGQEVYTWRRKVDQEDPVVSVSGPEFKLIISVIKIAQASPSINMHFQRECKLKEHTIETQPYSDLKTNTGFKL